MKRIITSSLAILMIIMCIAACSNIEDQIIGTYLCSDGQTLVLNSDYTVQYTDTLHNDSSSGTWEITDDKIVIHRVTPDGRKRHDISADIPTDGITSLYFTQVNDSEGTGNFSSGIFIKQ